MEDILAKLLKRLTEGEGEPDYSTWVQVATLTSKEKMRYRKIDRWGTLAASRAKRLTAQLDQIKANATVSGRLWWESLYKSHSLPEASYHITDDGKILMKPGSKE